MSCLVFDIETSALPRETLDETQLEYLFRPAENLPDEAERARKREEIERRKKQRAVDSLHKRIADLESRIAERETQVRDLEAAMGVAGFYDDPSAASTSIGRHKALMWEVGDLIAQWEALQAHASES